MSEDPKLLQINQPKLKPSSENQKGEVSEVTLAESDVDYEDCKTPSSDDHKIPTIQSCPPTPRKKVQVSNFLKRKIPEILFFEATKRGEVESFFRSNSELFKVEFPAFVKKRCKSL
ncbi:Cyclin-dependent protein kinase [Melia azedarach]|uniref:Cyclin-dependent protein kinase n=1 Tax=Melia azedarach TaxID=155640 RepID=A0ACC1YPB3_MELAZ|nr:Cyclin-dependent protein kinase [Melia azedarach]